MIWLWCNQTKNWWTRIGTLLNWFISLIWPIWM